MSGMVFSLYGAPGLFIASALFFIFALLVLMGVREYPHIRMTQGVRQVFESTPKNGLFMSLYIAFQDVFINTLWAIVLFFLFHEDTVYMGGILSFIMASRIIIEYFIGHAIDFQYKTRWYQWGIFIITVSVIGRTFFGFSVENIIFFNIILMIGYSLFTPYAAVFTYNSIKDSQHPESFTFLSESGDDLGSIIAYFLIAFFVYYGLNMRYLILIGIVSLPFVVLLYRQYFSLPLRKN